MCDARAIRNVFIINKIKNVMLVQIFSLASLNLVLDLCDIDKLKFGGIDDHQQNT